jgi:hypothetical protein
VLHDVIAEHWSIPNIREEFSFSLTLPTMAMARVFLVPSYFSAALLY